MRFLLSLWSLWLNFGQFEYKKIMIYFYSSLEVSCRYHELSKIHSLKYLQNNISYCALLSHFSHDQLFVTPVDHNPLGSSVHGILQAKILEWIAVYYSRGSFWPRDQTHVSCISCIGRPVLYLMPPGHW